MDLGLDGRVVLVTGASGGIGAAIARAFAAEGALVAAGWHGDEAGAAATLEGGKGMTVRLDHRDPDSLVAAVDRVTAALGPIAVLVANAVAWPTTREPDTYARLVDGFTANAAAPIALTEAALPGMRSAGFGRIVLISSDVVDQPVPAAAAYPAAKGALEAAAKVLAVREARHGILTNVVRPGYTLTARTADNPYVNMEAEKTPTGRVCTPQDVAAATLWLGSAANTHVNGETLSVSGGRQLTR